MKEQTRP